MRLIRLKILPATSESAGGLHASGTTACSFGRVMQLASRLLDISDRFAAKRGMGAAARASG
jgi:hypothetical protein